VTPALLSALSAALGLDEQTVDRGLQIVEPLLCSALAQISQSPEGRTQIMAALPRVAEAVNSDGLQKLVRILANQGRVLPVGGKDFLTNLPRTLLGDGVGAIGAALDRSLGFRASPLIAVAAPILLNQLDNLAKTQGLDQEGIAALLQKEQSEFLRKGGEPYTIVKHALQTGENVAKLRHQFSDDEWTRIRQGPLAAAALVVLASPSKPTELSQEFAALARTFSQVIEHSSPESLLGIAFQTPLTEFDLQRFTERSKRTLLNAVSDATHIVNLRAELSVGSYRYLLTSVAKSTAEAAKEGGFLGFGGKQVSDAEQSVLAEIEAAAETIAPAARG